MREDVEVPVKVKLSALWASVMFCYIYADYFALYTQGKLQAMMRGQIGPLGAATEGVLVGTSVLMAIPALMIFLSVALKPALNRWLNIIFGVLYTLVILLTMWGPAFFVFYGVVEVTLTGLVVWYAWRWPRRAA